MSSAKRKEAAHALWAIRHQVRRAQAIGKLCNAYCLPWPTYTEFLLRDFHALRERAKTYPKT